MRMLDMSSEGSVLPLTIVVNTYHREFCLRRVLLFYLTCPVAQIRVSWNQPRHGE